MQVSHKAPGRLAIAALVLFALSCGWIMGLPTAFWKTASLNYDDAEYAYQAIDTVERLHRGGLLSWPRIVYVDQHYGKPPLFVNSIAASIELTGRDRSIEGIQLAVATSNFALLAAAGIFFARRYGTAGGLLAALMVAALPAFVSWAPRVVPDIQVSFLAFAAAAILVANPRNALPTGACIALGVIWGLGMHSKATYPLYAAGPVLLWLVHATSARRIFSLLVAALIALALTAVWYLSNFEEAIKYVRGAVDFVDDPDTSRVARFGHWLHTLTLGGFGWLPGVLVLLACVIHVRGRARAVASPDHDLLVRSLFFAALPMLLLSLTSTAPPNTRHPLPSLILVSLAATAILMNHWRNVQPAQRLRPWFAIALLAAQAGVFMTDITRAERPAAEREELQRIGRLLAPGLSIQRAIDDTVPLHAFKTIESKLGSTPATVYLAGHDGSLHVPKLNLLAIMDNRALRFDYATYFSWSHEQGRARLQQIVDNGEPILLLENKLADATSASRYFNRHQSLAVGTLSPLIGSRYSSLMLVDNAERRLQLLIPHHLTGAEGRPLRSIDASFANALTVVGIALEDDQLVIRLRATARIDKNYKLMIHAAQTDNPLATTALDQYVAPPLTTWLPGSQRDIRVRLPAGLEKRPLRIKIGFFDEADAANNWPRLRTQDGQDAIEVELDASTEAAPVTAAGESR
jgi:4-amino-4-deoxy-L-arabinose transferase-like glycosyltransferase